MYVFHVIRPEYCKMLGIPEDDMIAEALGDAWVKKLDADIPEHFRQLPPEMPLGQKVFEAHVAAYNGAMEQIMEFVKDRFFSKYYPKHLKKKRQKRSSS